MIIVALGVLGLMLGSFVNALVWRVHEQAVLAGKKGANVARRRQELSVLKGRSMCPHCSHTLAAKDLVPVFSWLALAGKCRYCGKPIAWQYPVVELLTGLLFAVSYMVWPLDFSGAGLLQFVLWLVFITGFMALAVYDLRWMLLPNRIVVPLTILAALQTCVVALWQADVAQLYQPLLGAGLIFGLFWVLYQLSGGKWIGGGDVKLAVALGLLAGTPLNALLVIFLASLFGTIGSIPVMLRGKQALGLHIPFGPYLLLATVAVVLWGAALFDWYQGLFTL